MPVEGAPTRRLALIVEDEFVLARMVSLYLVNDGWRTKITDTAEEAIDIVATDEPTLVLMDLTLNGSMDGIDACRRIRESSRATIMVMSARANESDLRVALAAGADDYVTKPFSARELVSRLNLMRAAEADVDDAELRQFGSLEIDAARHEARLDGVRQPLTRTEFDLLRTLANEPTREFTADELGCRVWGDGWRHDDSAVAEQVSHLRRVLGDNVTEARFVVTVAPDVYRMGSGR